MSTQPHRPTWFKYAKVLIINAPTCGINKDGDTQYKVSDEGERSATEIDDKLYDTVKQLKTGNYNSSFYYNYESVSKIVTSQVWVPQFHDNSSEEEIESLFADSENFKLVTLQMLHKDGKIAIFHGHGSPSSDQRIGDVPYIKVSDIRAGQININPTNRIPKELAEKFWRGEHSGLNAYDLISPERASKNIGEFAVLMPGQENIVLTKEVLVIRSMVQETEFDQFYLMWALSLETVRNQWKRVILMQTNREDVGNRYLQIKIPIPHNIKVARAVSSGFREYYMELSLARNKLYKSLHADEYKHIFQLG